MSYWPDLDHLPGDGVDVLFVVRQNVHAVATLQVIVECSGVVSDLCLADPALVLGLRGDGRLELLGVFHDGVVVDILEVVDELLIDFRVEGATNFAGVVALIAPLGRLLLPSDVGLKIRAKLHLAVNFAGMLTTTQIGRSISKGIRKKRQISSYTVSKFVQKTYFH